MLQESDGVCNLCEAGVVLCVPGTKAECAAFNEFLCMEEIPIVKRHVTNKSEAALIEQSIPNSGIMNRLTGQIVEIVEGQVMAKLTIKVENNYISSLMPIDEFNESRRNVGDTVSIAFKSVNVKLMVRHIEQ